MHTSMSTRKPYNNSLNVISNQCCFHCAYFTSKAFKNKLSSAEFIGCGSKQSLGSILQLVITDTHRFKIQLQHLFQPLITNDEPDNHSHILHKMKRRQLRRCVTFIQCKEHLLFPLALGYLAKNLLLPHSTTGQGLLYSHCSV